MNRPDAHFPSKHPMVIPYDDISNLDRNKAATAADKILARGWARRQYPVVFLAEPIPWALESQAMRSWNFHIHSWEMVDSILKAHSESGDAKYLRAAIGVALDWDREHAGPERPEASPFAWYDMAVGLRCYRLAYILDAGTAAGLLDADQQARLWSALERHATYLADDANIAFHSNHGYYQVAGQLAMGRRFAAVSSSMAAALEQGQARLRTILDQQFAADGVHREHSPDYHRMVYETLRGLLDAGLVTDPGLVERAAAIERALSWFILPNQRLANFGDSDYRVMARQPSEAGRKWLTPEMQYAVSNGGVGTAPQQDHMAFAEGGYFVVRRPSPTAPADPAQRSYLAQAAAFHSRTHKQADDLSFIWSDRGSDILVDAGRYGYIGKAEQGSALWQDGHWYSDPNRVYCESTRAHNTLEFDGLNYPRKGVKPYGSALRRWTRQAATGLFAVETECKHFHGIRRARLLLFMPSQWLIVLDWFHDNDKAPHQVRQWFHLAPHLELKMEGGAARILGSGSAEPLHAVSLLEGPVASRAYLAETTPTMQGWWSGQERDAVPAYAFCQELQGVMTGSFATLFTFSGQVTPNLAMSRVAPSGRKGQLRWSDSSARHGLKFERSDGDGPLVVEYEAVPERKSP